jgi:selenocysteine lyase/cysteine desulfurase
MPFDPAPWRQDTAAATAGRVHLNNAGASLMPRPVADAVTDHLRLELQVGGYEAADAARPDIEQAYEDLAALVGARARNIAIVENATVAFDQALSSFDFAPGDVILTTRSDYISNQLAYLSLARRHGVRVVRADDAQEGGVDPDSVRHLLRVHRPRLVALTWVPTSSGLVQPAAVVGELCRDAGVPYLVDACQAAGQIEVDVAALHCDFLAATGRKFLRGPRGSGFLYVADSMLERGAAPLWIDMQGARWISADAFELVASARRFENWEFAYALVLGLGAAARYAARVGVGPAGAWAAALARTVRERLSEQPGTRVLDRGPELCAIVAVAFDGHDAGTIVERLREQAINTSAIRRESALLDMDAAGAVSAVRISPHYYNTMRDVETLLFALEEWTWHPT